MKKILLAVLLLIIALVCIYFYIPNKITISKVSYVKNNVESVKRFLFNEGNWVKWWPQDSSENVLTKNDRIYTYGQLAFDINKQMYSGFNIIIQNRDRHINSSITIIPLGDSVIIHWMADMPETRNPLKKISYYNYANKVFNSMGAILNTLKKYLENNKNVYGVDITEIMVTDTLLISAKSLSNAYPSVENIYILVKNLQQYILENGAAITNPPMLNILKDTSGYRTMVAIPINKRVPENNYFTIKNMVPGKILVTEVKGGPNAANNAVTDLNNFIVDHNMTTPAIPFQSLITDRSKEADTTKWITKIYYPVY